LVRDSGRGNSLTGPQLAVRSGWERVGKHHVVKDVVRRVGNQILPLSGISTLNGGRHTPFGRREDRGKIQGDRQRCWLGIRNGTLVSRERLHRDPLPWNRSGLDTNGRRGSGGSWLECTSVRVGGRFAGQSTRRWAVFAPMIYKNVVGLKELTDKISICKSCRRR
jgi:hypothetical protein